MPIDLIKFAFIGGEVSDAYAGRSDLEKFDLSLAQAENWQVDYLGGLSNCPGTIFCEPIEYDEYETKLFTFKFSSDESNTNLILFGKGYIRFLQGEAYVLEEAKSVTGITAANPIVVTALAHGYSLGDIVQFPDVAGIAALSNRTFRAIPLSADTFSLQSLWGTDIDGSSNPAYVSGGTVARVYTLPSIYAPEDLRKLRAHQIRDVIRLTHPDYLVHNLRRLGQANWTFTEETYERTVGIPSSITLTTNVVGNYGAAYVITAVDEDGIESLPSDYAFVTDSADLENNANSSVSVTWAPVVNAQSYNIYRSRLAFLNAHDTMSRSAQVGLIGRSNGSYFLDTGVTPDFTKTVPVGNNPFADAAITYVTVSDGGTGYAKTDTVTVTDSTGSGFVGYPIISTAAAATGPIVGVIIVNGGKNYSAPAITVNTATGTGAVLIPKLRDATGNSPALAGVYQQRQIYAAPTKAPLTIYGSKPGQLSNFDVSTVLIASDSFEHEIDSEDFSPLLHLIPTRGGLLLCSKAGIWLMSGSQNNAVTATDVQAEPQTYTGTSEVEPLKIDTDILYCNAAGRRVNALAYADQYKLYSPTDISILASHLFEKHTITRWAYASEPHRIIHAIRADGTMLLLTMIKEHEIYAWTRRITKGEFIDVVSLEETEVSSVYCTVRRYINGRYMKFVEKVASREVYRVDECVFLDSALSVTPTYGAYSLSLSAASGDAVAAKTNGEQFSLADVGKIIRYGLGKARITNYVNARHVTVTVIDPFDIVVPFQQNADGLAVPKLAEPDDWTIDEEFTVVSGLHHLEGETVSALADGNVVSGLTVTDGTVTLPQAASRVTVGIPYESIAKALPIAVPQNVVENKVKNITHVAMRVRRSRGLTAGVALDALYKVKTRGYEAFGEPNTLKNGTYVVAVEPNYDIDTTILFKQEEPLPVTILGYVLESEIGDA